MYKPLAWILSVLFISGAIFSLAHSQTVTTPSIVALACAYNSAAQSISSGQFALVQCDSGGNLKLSNSSFIKAMSAAVATTNFGGL